MFEGRVFKYGKDNYEMSRQVAKVCPAFREDDEDEQVDHILISCYNCMYRRWLSNSFECMK